MEQLRGKNLTDIEGIVKGLNLPSYTSSQIAQWLYGKFATDIDEMTNISRQNRDLLKSRFVVGRQEPVKERISVDGTKKYLFPAGKGRFIEAALIPDRERHTLCVSSQVGCKRGCLFCATGRQGLQGQLSSGEIINQVLSLPERDKLDNLVFMGMGEPLDNLEAVLKSIEIMTAPWGLGWSPRRITLSTVGIIPAMKSFLEKSQCNLAISLNSPFENERLALMPVEKQYPLKQITAILRSIDTSRQRRISFEYIVFKGWNDSRQHINELARLLNGLRCRINLIGFHKIEGLDYESPSMADMEKFMLSLNEKGIRTTIRASRGQDIEAACGLLSTKHLTY